MWINREKYETMERGLAERKAKITNLLEKIEEHKKEFVFMFRENYYGLNSNVSCLRCIHNSVSYGEFNYFTFESKSDVYVCDLVRKPCKMMNYDNHCPAYEKKRG